MASHGRITAQRSRSTARASAFAAAAGVLLMAGSGAVVVSRAHGTDPPIAIARTTLRLVDTTRTIALRRHRTAPRTLVTYLYVPTPVAPSGSGTPVSAGPMPLIVFAHGYAVTPDLYSQLLQAWARAGYVVAAPVFPLENANAPGGPDESDIVNEPADVTFVISRLLEQAATAGSALSGKIDPTRIGVAGHSDGAEVALAVSCLRAFRDLRVRAAAILSGARMPEGGGMTLVAPTTPLLAAQGTRDRINEPKYTRAFYRVAKRPKFLLSLTGAGHLAPYTVQQPQLGVVERVTIAFFDHYLKSAALQPLLTSGTVAGVSRLDAQP